MVSQIDHFDVIVADSEFEALVPVSYTHLFRDETGEPVRAYAGPLPAPESDREIRLLTREVYYDKLAVKERFIRINLKGDGRWKSCLTGNTCLLYTSRCV